LELEQLRELLSMGGDTATMALVFILWKLDRRILAVELHTGILKPKLK
jgi:hypothetical protein